MKLMHLVKLSYLVTHKKDLEINLFVKTYKFYDT